MFFDQAAHKLTGVVFKGIVGEFPESLQLTVRILGPRVRRKQHSGSETVGISPLDCLQSVL